MKTHSGASKRIRVKPGGLLKRRKTHLRHLLSNRSSKRKRHLGIMTYVHPSNLNNIKRLLPGQSIK